jgi:hypothetical protein
MASTVAAAATAVENTAMGLKNWEDAFAQPIPNVRIIEKRLRLEIGGNRERLRGLVGYVCLLSFFGLETRYAAMEAFSFLKVMLVIGNIC